MTQTQQPDAGPQNLQYYAPPQRSFLESLMSSLGMPQQTGFLGMINQKHADALAQQEYDRQMIGNVNNANAYYSATGKTLDPRGPVDLKDMAPYIQAIQQSNQNPNMENYLQGGPLHQAQYGAYDPQTVQSDLKARQDAINYQEQLRLQHQVSSQPPGQQPPQGMSPSQIPISQLPQQPQAVGQAQPLPPQVNPSGFLPPPIRNAIMAQPLNAGANFQAPPPPQIQQPPPQPPTGNPFFQPSLPPEAVNSLFKNNADNQNTQTQLTETQRKDKADELQKKINDQILNQHYIRGDQADNTKAGAAVTSAGADVTKSQAEMIKANKYTGEAGRAPNAIDLMTPEQKMDYAARISSGLNPNTALGSKNGAIIPNDKQAALLKKLKDSGSDQKDWFGNITGPGDIKAARQYNSYAKRYGIDPIPLPGDSTKTDSNVLRVPTAAEWAKSNH